MIITIIRCKLTANPKALFCVQESKRGTVTKHSQCPQFLVKFGIYYFLPLPFEQRPYQVKIQTQKEWEEKVMEYIQI